MKIPALPLLVLVALGSQGRLPAQGNDRSLHFAWPVPCDVEVTEQRQQRGRVLLLKYKLEVRPTQYEGIFVLRRREFEVLKVNGLESTSPELRGMVAPIEANLAVVPDLYIDKQGQMVDIETWDSFAARAGQLIGELQRDGDLPDNHATEVLELRRRPEVRETLRVLATEYWVLWVNGWLDLDFSKSSALEVPGEFPIESGGVVSAPQTLRHNGTVAGHEEYVQLSMESILDGNDVKGTVIQSLNPMVSPEKVTRAVVSNTAWVVLRPDTMQPVEAMSESKMTLVAGDDIREAIELRKYKLEWK